MLVNCLGKAAAVCCFAAARSSVNTGLISGYILRGAVTLSFQGQNICKEGGPLGHAGPSSTGECLDGTGSQTPNSYSAAQPSV